MGQSERFWTDQYFIFYVGYYESRRDFRNIPWTWDLLSLFSRLPSSSIIVCFMCRPLAFELEGFCTSHGFCIFWQECNIILTGRTERLKSAFCGFASNQTFGRCCWCAEWIHSSMWSTAQARYVQNGRMLYRGCRSIALHRVNVLHLYMLL